ncbi:MAG: DUF4118 domain-containing protein, partial [Chloroflexales bacterium]|nr:DUF4118 domain-containing protein [Chloroflexales bacterium]
MSETERPPSPLPTLSSITTRPKWLSADYWSRWPGYVLALTATGLTLLARFVLGSAGDAPLLELFQLTIIFSAYVGGLGPGLVATAVAALLTDYLLLPPIYSFSIRSAIDSAEWLMLLLTGTLVSGLSEGLHRARRRAAASQQLQAV